jgi:hypothetical protein
MKHSLAGALCAGAVSLGLVTSADAALESRLGGQALYDTDLGITWLSTNLAASNTFNVSGIFPDGQMSWNAAQSWIGAMNNGAGYLGYNDWRLPMADPSCSGYNCFSSELGHLFYNELGGQAGSSIASVHNGNYGLFSNLPSDVFWSGTEDSLSNAWTLDFSNGFQNSDLKSYDLYAWAVRPGDIAAVPVPGALWLFGSGLAGLVTAVRRRRRR